MKSVLEAKAIVVDAMIESIPKVLEAMKESTFKSKATIASAKL